MANPTTNVPVTKVPYAQTKVKWALPVSADTYQVGEMIGKRNSDGLGQHFDDTQYLTFLGINASSPRLVITTDLPQQAVEIDIDRPRLFSMPLATGTASRLTDINKPVFAVNSGAVQLGAAGLTYANLVGFVADVLTSAPEAMTGTSVLITPQWAVGRQTYLRVLTAPATGGHTYGDEAINALIIVPATAAETITLPPVADTMPGDEITFLNTAGAHVVTLQGNASEDINGSNTYAMSGTQYGAAVLTSIGTAWIVTNGKVL